MRFSSNHNSPTVHRGRGPPPQKPVGEWWGSWKKANNPTELLYRTPFLFGRRSLGSVAQITVLPSLRHGLTFSQSSKGLATPLKQGRSLNSSVHGNHKTGYIKSDTLPWTWNLEPSFHFTNFSAKVHISQNWVSRNHTIFISKMRFNTVLTVNICTFQ